MQEGNQNGVQINAKTHQQSMQQMVAKKVRKQMKNQVLLMCEIIQIHNTVIKKQGECASIKFITNTF